VEIRATIFEGNSKHKHSVTSYLQTPVGHLQHQLLKHPADHAVVDEPIRQHNLQMIAKPIKVMSEILLIKCRTEAANQPRPKKCHLVPAASSTSSVSIPC